MRTTFIKTLIELAEKDEKIILLTADMGFGVFEKFKEKFPERFFNVGISEQNMIGIASGLALTGYKVYVYSIIPFLIMRSFEQIRIDVAYHNLNIKLIGVGGGVAYGPAGATHHAIEDIALMRSLPNMNVIAPGDPVEAKLAILESYKNDIPTYVRLSRNNEPIIHKDEKFNIYNGISIRENLNSKIALISIGNFLESVNNISESLKKEKIAHSFYSIPCIKPLNNNLIETILKNYEYIFIFEEHNKIGGLYSAIMEIVGSLNKEELSYKQIYSFSINDEFSHYVGSQNWIRKCYNLDEENILYRLKEYIKNKS